MKIKQLIKGLFVTTLSLLLLSACGDKDTTDEISTTSEVTATAESSAAKEAVNLESLDLPQLNSDVAENEDLVELVTNMGNIKIKLFPEYAPKAVENFMTLAKDGYYNGVSFHRVINEFMIQGGDPDGTGMGGESIWGGEFVPEISNNLYHIRGALAMARTGLPLDQPSQSSQFYIVQNDEDQTSAIKNGAGQYPLSADEYPSQILEAYKNGGTPFLDSQYSVFGQVVEGMNVVDKIAEVETGASDKPKENVIIEKVEILKEAE